MTHSTSKISGGLQQDSNTQKKIKIYSNGEFIGTGYPNFTGNGVTVSTGQDGKIDIFIQKDSGLNYLYSEFNHSDLINLKKKIGQLKKNTLIVRLDLIIEEPFNSSVKIKIGDEQNNEKFMKMTENMASKTYIYDKEFSYKYNEDTDIFLYFDGNSSVGKGKVFIFVL